jgi:outer membrane protein insertion porin family
MLKKTVVSLILLSSILSAQKIKAIKFEGLTSLSAAAAKEIAGIRVGEQMDIDKINESVVKFYNQGYFEDVTVEEKGGTLIYHFKEKKAIAKVDVKGMSSDEEIKTLLEHAGIKKGDLYDETKVEEAKKLLNEYLQTKGNYDSVVEVSAQDVGKRAVALTFEINKGEKIKIKKVNFIGAESLDKSTLESQLANKEEGMLSFIPLLGGGEVKVDQLEYDAYRLKDTYMRHGFLDVEVSPPLMRVDYSSYTAEVDYKIKEGPQYKVGKVRITPEIKGVNLAEIKENLKLKSGKIFDVSRMRKDMQRIKQVVGDMGYAYTKITPQFHKHPDKQTVDIQYVIQPGQRVKIHDVYISGNDKTKDRVIRRYIYLAPGDYFSASDLKESKAALARTGFFEKVDIQTRRVSEDQIDLLVKVKETSTGTISLGGGYGSYEGLMVNASVSNKNLFGSGISGSLGIEFSDVATNFNLSFVNPRLWDSLYSLGFSIYKRKYDYYDYKEDTFGTSLNIGRQFYRHWYASVGIGYIDNQSEINPDSPNYSSLIESLLYNDKYQKLSGFASVKFDNTDDYYTPREGYIFMLNGEFASLDGDDYNPQTYPGGYGNFTKFSARFGAYYGLEDMIDYDLILRFKARGTIINKDDMEKLPVAERLFMGGIGSVRGYQPYTIAPAIHYPDGSVDRIGGTYRASASFEASIPLSEAAKMRLAFFYDVGVIGSSDERYTIPNTDIVKTATFDDITRSSVGAVLEWNSGFGPINLVFGYALDDEPGDETSTFEFSMGTKF